MRALTARLSPFLRKPTTVDASTAPMFADFDTVLPRQPSAPAAVPPLRPRVQISVQSPSVEEAAKGVHRDRGRHLARQDAWEVLALELSAADESRAMTSGLRPISALLAQGARSDAVAAATSAILAGRQTEAEAALKALEANREDLPNCSALAYVVAAAHVDAAFGWRRASRASANDNGFVATMKVAARLADHFDPHSTGSALWAHLRCMVLDVDANPAKRVADDFEDLIELEPGCPDHMRAFGRDLLPRRYGSFEAIETHARRVADLTGDIWGMGGYAWVWIGAMEVDPAAQRLVDAILFRKALRDILDRFPDQHMVNRMAAFTGITLGATKDITNSSSALSDEFLWIAGERLTELHPLIWERAAAPGRKSMSAADKTDSFTRGRAAALSILAERFAPEIGRSGHIVFAQDGLQRV